MTVKMKYYKVKGDNQLAEDERLHVEIYEQASTDYIFLDNGDLTIKKGYVWDGSTIPLKFITRFFWYSDEFSMTASLVHDALLELMRKGLVSKKYKQYSDALYRDMSVKKGMKKREGKIRYWFLRNFGAGGIKKRKPLEGEIIEV